MKSATQLGPRERRRLAARAIQTPRQIGRALEVARWNAKLVDAELATALGVDAGTVLGWEQGRRYPPLHMVFEIAKICGAPPERLTP